MEGYASLSGQAKGYIMPSATCALIDKDYTSQQKRDSLLKKRIHTLKVCNSHLFCTSGHVEPWLVQVHSVECVFVSRLFLERLLSDPKVWPRAGLEGDDWAQNAKGKIHALFRAMVCM